MRATMHFSPDEMTSSFPLHLKGPDWALAMWDLDMKLRGLVKYVPEDAANKDTEPYDKVRTMLREILNERGLSLDDIQ